MKSIRVLTLMIFPTIFCLGSLFAANLHFEGKAKNLQSQFASDVWMTIQTDENSTFQVIGQFDNVTLFGRFNLPGKTIECPEASTFNRCLHFSGKIAIGHDGSNFPSRTRIQFEIWINMSNSSATGRYLIHPIPPYFLNQQPGELNFKATEDNTLLSGFNEEIAANPQDARKYWNRAIYHELHENFVAAAVDFRRFISLKPLDGDGYGMLSWMLIRNGQWTEATPHARKATELDPVNPFWVMMLAHIDLLAGRKLQALGKYRDTLHLIKNKREFEEGPVADLNLFIKRGLNMADARLALAYIQKYYPDIAAVPYERANLLGVKGYYKEAIPFFQTALLISEQNLGKEHPFVGELLVQYANVMLSTSQIPESIDFFERALDIFDNSMMKSHKSVIYALEDLADLYQTLGSYEKAEKLILRAIEVCDMTDVHPIVKIDLKARLGVLWGNYMGKPDEAIKLYEQAFSDIKKIMGPFNPYMAKYLNDYAILLSQAGHTKEAIAYYERALLINEQAWGADHPNVATNCFNLAIQYRSLNETSKAEEYLIKALGLASKSGLVDLTWRIQNMLSSILNEQNNPEAGIFWGKQAVNTVQTMRSGITTINKDLQKIFVKDKAYIYRELTTLLIDNGRLAEAQQVLAMLKEEEYHDFIRRNTANGKKKSTTASYSPLEKPWADRYGELTSRLAVMCQELAVLKDKKRSARSVEEQTRYKQLKKKLKVANRQFSEYLFGLKETFRRMGVERAEDLAAKNLECSEQLKGVLKDLGHGAVIIHYLMTDQRLSIILTTPLMQLHRESRISSKDLNRKIFNFREDLQNPNSDPMATAQELYKLLIAPIENDLKLVKAKTLMLSLDGTLRYLPFATLHDGEKFLAETYATVLFTEAARTNLKDQPSRKWEIAGLGVSAGTEDFSPLPAVHQELNSIVLQENPEDREGILQGIIHMDSKFTVDALTEALEEEYPVIHIASHFSFNPGTESDSFLLIGNGRKLTLADIKEGDFPFSDVELLTLSACETAIGGKASNGREIEGLGALAQNKGAKGVLATLWPVADNSTGIFMLNLYQLREKGKLTKAEALRHTQLLFIKNAKKIRTDAKRRGKITLLSKETGDSSNRKGANPGSPDQVMDSYMHPFYWAPFILMGNWL